MAIKSAMNTVVHHPEDNEPDQQYGFAGQGSVLQPLTKREREILNWLSEGKSSIEISIILGICESTVKFHVNNTLSKLQATNRTHAVAIALRRRLI